MPSSNNMWLTGLMGILFVVIILMFLTGRQGFSACRCNCCCDPITTPVIIVPTKLVNDYQVDSLIQAELASIDVSQGTTSLVSAEFNLRSVDGLATIEGQIELRANGIPFHTLKFKRAAYGNEFSSINVVSVPRLSTSEPESISIHYFNGNPKEVFVQGPFVVQKLPVIF